jgi:F-type H+-transporting ATPase subunit gamma
MASRRELNRRIKSIRNTAQITKAMQMVSASYMRRAQNNMEAARPYSEHIREVVADIAVRPGTEAHPMLLQREIRNVGIVAITPDRGLAGALVANVNREIFRVAHASERPIRVVVMGRKGRDFVLRNKLKLVGEFIQIGNLPGMDVVAPAARIVLDEYENGEVDIVHLVYTEFQSTLRQRPKSIQLLPVLPPEKGAEVSGPWNYEPDNPMLVLSELLPRYVEFMIFHAMLESIASAHSARMVAMSNATDNAQELIRDLTLMSNKARQAEITKEISEISGAAEAILTG